MLQSPFSQRQQLKATTRRRNSALSDSAKFGATFADSIAVKQCHKFLKLFLPPTTLLVGVSVTSLDDPTITPQTGAEPDTSNGPRWPVTMDL